MPHSDVTANAGVQSISSVPTSVNSSYSLMQPSCESTSDPEAAGEHTSSRRASQIHQVAGKIGAKHACACGTTFTRAASLKRHIQTFQDGGQSHSGPKCPLCTSNKAFKRKDHLRQHLQHAHGKSPKQISDILRISLPGYIKIPLCHFPSCAGYFEPSLISPSYDPDQAFSFSREFRKHMKDDHGWSPYSCDVSGCEKTGGNGFFDFEALTRHRVEEHPGAPEAQKPRVTLERKWYRLCPRCFRYLPYSSRWFIRPPHYHSCIGAIPEGGQATAE